jgi:hypothetical protein
MFCDTQFTHSQIQHLGLTKSFLQGDFAKHQQDVLFAQEQAMLPAAQAAVAHDRLIKDIDHQIKDVSAQIKQLVALKLDLLHTKRQLQRHDHAHALDADDPLQEQFIHRCADSACNGFVSSAWKCATCDKHTCAHCRELKDHAHLCNPDSVASVALLKHDTKPCPNCKVPVHKTEGCDQMFCTRCKRLWSWNTGRFETRGHNPHFLQWMRDNQPGGMPRDPNDVQCGREIDHHFLRQLYNLITHTLQHTLLHAPHQHDALSHQCHTVYNFIGSIPHLRFHDLIRFTVDRTEINLHARKAFVSNTLSLDRFKQTIRRNHLIAIKNEHIAQLIQAVIQATTDIAFRFSHLLQPLQPQPLQPLHIIAHADFAPFVNELYNLHSYANHELNIIHYDFHSPPLQRHLFKHHSFKIFH